jgi:hypothetical protein
MERRFTVGQPLISDAAVLSVFFPNRHKLAILPVSIVGNYCIRTWPDGPAGECDPWPHAELGAVCLQARIVAVQPGLPGSNGSLCNSVLCSAKVPVGAHRPLQAFVQSLVSVLWQYR